MATILLLGLTVTLFSTIFFFVNTFPRPASQSANQFQASLLYDSTGRNIIAVQILHLAGPALSSPSATIYIRSSLNPNYYTAPYTMAAGLNGSNVWSLGQTWNLTLVPVDPVPDNLTLSVVSGSQLVFSVSVPGKSPSYPPLIFNMGTNPTTPYVAQSINFTAFVTSPYLNVKSVYINVSLVSGASGTLLKAVKMVKGPVPNEYYYVLASGVTTTAGTYFVYLNASNTGFGKTTTVLAVTIQNAGTQFTAAAQVNPVPLGTKTAATLSAVVTSLTASGALKIYFNYTVGATVTAVGTYTGTITVGQVVTAFCSKTFTTASSATTYIINVTAVVNGVYAYGTLTITT